MPEVRGFYEKNIIIKGADYRFVKLFKEIEELKNSSYELIYDNHEELYNLYFDLKGDIYCIDIGYTELLLEESIPDLYMYKDKIYSFIHDDGLEKEVNNLILNIKNIIKNNSSDRIKFLLNNKIGPNV